MAPGRVIRALAQELCRPPALRPCSHPPRGYYALEMRSLKTFHCIDCGELTSRLRDTGQPLVCREHGIARAVAAAVELARAKAAGWPAGGRFTREQFAAPQRKRWERARSQQAR